MKKLLLICTLATATFGSDATHLRIGGPLPIVQSAAIAATVCTIDAANKACSWIFQATDAVPITTLLFHYGNSTGTPVKHRISIQGVAAGSSIGMPDGTVVAAAAFTPPTSGDAANWEMTGTALAGCTVGTNCLQAVSISNDGAGGSISSFTPVRGTFYSIVIETCPGATAPCSGSVSADGSNKGTFVISVGNTGNVGRTSVPYALTNSAALPSTTWSKNAEMPLYGYRTASATYGNPLLSITSTATSTATQETGVSFTIPSTWFSTYKVAGVRFIGQTPAVNGTVKLNLYAGNGSATPIQSLSWDSDITRVNTTGIEAMTLYFSDTTLQTLSTGTTYRIALEPSASGTAISLTTWDLAAAGDRSAFPGGTNFAYTSRSGCTGACSAQTSVTFTDTTTSRPFMELILDDIAYGGGATGYIF